MDLYVLTMNIYCNVDFFSHLILFSWLMWIGCYYSLFKNVFCHRLKLNVMVNLHFGISGRFYCSIAVFDHIIELSKGFNAKKSSSAEREMNFVSF